MTLNTNTVNSRNCFLCDLASVKEGSATCNKGIDLSELFDDNGDTIPGKAVKKAKDCEYYFPWGGMMIGGDILKEEDTDYFDYY